MSEARTSVPGTGKPEKKGLSPGRGVWLVARREIDTRLRTKAFVLSTLGLLLGLGIYALVLHFVSAGGATTVGLGARAEPLRPALTAAAEQSGKDLRFVSAPEGAEAEQQVRDGDMDALLHGPPDRPRLTVERSADPGILTAVDAAARQYVADRYLGEAGVDPAELREELDGTGVRVASLEPVTDRDAGQLVLGMASTGLLYLFLVLFGIVLAQGVVEEKSSRVVELLLSSIRPWQLLAGKIIGVAVVGLCQFVLIGGTALAVARASGLVDLPSAVGATLFWLGLWYVLGFFLFATLLAAAAARVSRQEEVQSVVQPVMVLLAAPFVLGVALLSKNPDDPVIEVLSLFPPFSPVLMPARMVLGVAPAWQAGVALLLTLLALAAMLRTAGRVYTNSVLRNGARVSWTEALRSTR